MGHGGRIGQGWALPRIIPAVVLTKKGHKVSTTGEYRLECVSRPAFPRAAAPASKLVADLFANCLDLGDQPPARNRELTMLAGRQAHRKMEFLGSKRKGPN